ncbi:MAG: single-stranded DNA-binding protein [Turicibacter sp.]|nr:single-stranded DNA-binding protein [Turicibacter sp.]
MINRVVLVGRLTRDPELKYTTNGIANLRFSIAVNRTFTSQNGERQADFINCVAWRGQAENMAKFLRKGSLIGVEGRIETGSYQAQGGSMRYTTDVVCDSVQFLEPRSASVDRGSFGAQPSQDFGGGYGGTPSFQQQAPVSNAFSGNPFGGSPSMDQGFANPTQSFNNEPDFSSTINISDDDLPF